MPEIERFEILVIGRWERDDGGGSDGNGGRITLPG